MFRIYYKYLGLVVPKSHVPFKEQENIPPGPSNENMSVGFCAPQEACKSAPFGFPTMQIIGCSVVKISAIINSGH